jgi:hypothetical protein
MFATDVPFVPLSIPLYNIAKREVWPGVQNSDVYTIFNTPWVLNLKPSR